MANPNSTQRVIMRNTHPLQTHVIYDWAMQPITLKPGEQQEVEMTIAALDVFYERRRKGRTYINHQGIITEHQLHPVMILKISEDVGPGDKPPWRTKDEARTVASQAS